MKKLIKLTEDTHQDLKMYIVSNRIKTFEEGIRELLSKTQK